MDYGRAVLSISETVATLLRNGDRNFYQAFDEAFQVSNFHPDDKRKVMMEVGSLLNWRRQKKRYAQSRKALVEASMPPKPVFRQDELGFTLSQYPD